MFTFGYMICMYLPIIAVILPVFSSPTGSPGHPDLDQTYPMSLSDDLREDTLHDLLQRNDLHEGLVSPNPWSSRETELWQQHTQSFMNSLETQTQQQPSSQEEPDATEQGVQHECDSHHISIDTSPQVHRFRDDSEPRSHHTRAHDRDDPDSMVYASDNLQNINAPVPPKWKNNDHILEEYKKFRCSCKRIFDGPMAHVTSSKVKTDMFLIWCGPDGEDTYDNFELKEDEMYHIDHIMEQFELYCEPIGIFMPLDTNSVRCPRENMRRQMPSMITFKNSVCNASSVMMRNI